MQFNNSGAFGGANVNYNSTTERTGFQKTAATTEATIHADSVTGETVDTPASITLGYTIDPSVDSPSSYAVSQIDAPSDSSGIAQSGTQVTNGSALYYSDASVSITTTFYGYKLIDGVKYYIGTASVYNFADLNDSNNFQIDYIWSAIGGAD
tara:strand:+ start:4729 stop:5184 length:456 start_codon:yes stop_codon:yes gene_type:complete